MNTKVNYELSGNLKPESTNKFIISDGNCGELEFLEGFKLCTVDKGTMQDLCQEAFKIVNKNGGKSGLKIVILGGNSCLDPKMLEGKSLEELNKEKEKFVGEYVFKVKQPVEDIRKYVEEKGGKLVICSFIPRLANFRVKCETTSEILSAAYMDCNMFLKNFSEKFGLPVVHVNRDLEVKPAKTPPYITGQRKTKTHLYNPDGFTLSLTAQRIVQATLQRVLKNWI